MNIVAGVYITLLVLVNLICLYHILVYRSYQRYRSGAVIMVLLILSVCALLIVPSVPVLFS